MSTCQRMRKQLAAVRNDLSALRMTVQTIPLVSESSFTAVDQRTQVVERTSCVCMVPGMRG